MAKEKGLMTPLLIRYSGFYDFKGTYKLLRKWCVDNDFKLYEDIFKEKPATAAGMDTELAWRAERKETSFIKYWVDIKVQFRDNQPVEIVQNGQKLNLFKARIQFEAEPYIEYDWQNNFGGKNAKFFLWVLWRKIIYWEWKLKHEDVLNELVFLLGEDVKKFLNMYAHSGVWYG